jgi:hypothetical protein
MNEDIKIVRCFICGDMGKQEEKFILLGDSYPVKLVGYRITHNGAEFVEEQNFVCKYHYLKLTHPKDEDNTNSRN